MFSSTQVKTERIRIGSIFTAPDGWCIVDVLPYPNVPNHVLVVMVPHLDFVKSVA